MNVSEASKIWIDYHHSDSKKQIPIDLIRGVMDKFCQAYGNQQLSELTTEIIFRTTKVRDRLLLE